MWIGVSSRESGVQTDSEEVHGSSDNERAGRCRTVRVNGPESLGEVTVRAPGQVVGTMDSSELEAEAVELLQGLGLKEYEAKSFVALSRMPSGTAKDISDTTDVPRTRVYDAIRVLEAKGLVEVQHSNPRQFRAVPVEEAVASLQEEYASRTERLEQALSSIEPVEREEETIAQEVWGLGETDAIATRTERLIEEATEEVVLVVGSEALLTDEFLTSLAEASTRVNVIVGAVTEGVAERLRAAVPDAEVFVSGLEWLHGPPIDDGETAIGRLLLVDRETILLSSFEPESGKERAVFGYGFGNGIVVIARRLMATGLIPADDPGQP